MKKKLLFESRFRCSWINIYLLLRVDGFFYVLRLTVALFLLKKRKNCWRSCVAVAVAIFVFTFSFVLKSRWWPGGLFLRRFA